MYVIAGVSGNTGSIVANALLEQGKKVRVIVRDAKKGEPWKARGAEVAVATVGTKDIGRVAAKAILEPPAGKSEIIELAGPREYSSRDIAAALSKILGKPVEVTVAPLEAVVPTYTSFGISANIAGLFREMYA